ARRSAVGRAPARRFPAVRTQQSERRPRDAQRFDGSTPTNRRTVALASVAQRQRRRESTIDAFGSRGRSDCRVWRQLEVYRRVDWVDYLLDYLQLVSASARLRSRSLSNA